MTNKFLSLFGLPTLNAVPLLRSRIDQLRRSCVPEVEFKGDAAYGEAKLDLQGLAIICSDPVVIVDEAAKTDHITLNVETEATPSSGNQMNLAELLFAISGEALRNKLLWLMSAIIPYQGDQADLGLGGSGRQPENKLLKFLPQAMLSLSGTAVLGQLYLADASKLNNPLCIAVSGVELIAFCSISIGMAWSGRSPVKAYVWIVVGILMGWLGFLLAPAVHLLNGHSTPSPCPCPCPSPSPSPSPPPTGN